MVEEAAYEINTLRLLLIEAFEDNREVEFCLADHRYFATPRTDPPLAKCYGLLDASEKKWLFEGSVEDLFSFSFPSGYTLNDNLKKFDIMYIL